ncbi:nuclear transport factor 2 family protein [Dickeya solani]|uniref:Pyruvate kinase n=1 Tax=Dickeya solani D s0432-1 TaxID=1231725 RepID=A0AAV3KAG9_9GAMM|nr:nuclear transport factor 2 family protein [Dickeya solani]AUC44050.1 putative membrane protein [Dickeya solani RNS 08.23.3.1.A]AYQ46920.1 SnoaL-like domain protein [Dickeya solani]AYQ51092.1 SnoaL-like domain protein [Dickeya solani]ERO57902.1 putative pyruvate kinase [Dickeya solani D s0432-1]MBD3604442.1 putative pyruvate kinase [Dickeya solani]
MKKLFVVMLCLTALAPAVARTNSTPGDASAVSLTSKRDLAQEEKNRALVVEFYTEVLGNRRVDLADKYLSVDYIQHNPYAATGREAFVAFFRELFSRYPQSEHRIIRTATDGDLVYLHVFARNDPTERGRAVMDILRVDNGKIVEHWDVVQPIPETSANANGMF